MKHLNAYANRTDYDADENRASENTVSFIRDENKVIYRPLGYWDGIFADSLVGQILFEEGLIADSTQSTEAELALITELKYTFMEAEITKFPELQYFTSLVNMQGAFFECYDLTEAPIIPNSVTNMESTFIYCGSLTETPVIPNSVTNMESTFFECDSLFKAPVIPNSVTNLAKAFTWCTSLIEAPIIPDSVTNMSQTFAGCSSLNGKFIIEAVTPPTINQYTFDDVNVTSIKVPAQSVQAYKTASGWSDFADKIFPIE